MTQRKNASPQIASATTAGAVKAGAMPVDTSDTFYPHSTISVDPATGIANSYYLALLVKIFSQWTAQIINDAAGDGTDWKLVRAELDTKDPWQSEHLVASYNSPRLAGYMDGISGISADRPVTLKQIFLRLPDFAATIGGSGNLNVQIYNGTATTEGTLLTTITMAAGSNNRVFDMPAPINIAQNNVLRAKLVIGTTTGSGLQVQYRGEYQ